MLDARDLLNGLLEVMPSFDDYLAPNAEIVHSPDFESGVHGPDGITLRAQPPPLTLEMILFLKVNHKYWDVTTVDGCI
ncbi:hypothetical protein AM588_10010738 [Phytophthora nicotianae]|uniref:Uncharacterized protein n=1 Tax=Phytophthora nicotianae TaxID=4792 RepID=A0A0W8DRN4_PHYNI|nr:hypothetical protein AM588_10010738 [Phytophthora nicotianae]